MTSFVVEAGGGGGGEGMSVRGDTMSQPLCEQFRAIEVLWGNSAWLDGGRGLVGGRGRKNQYHEGQH